MRMNQMMIEDNQMKINHMRKQREQEKQKIQEAIFLSKREEAKQGKIVALQNKQKKDIFFS